MAQFSIKEAVTFSFVSYGKHFVLLLSASAIVGASLWLATVGPRYVAEKLGIEHHLIRQDSNAVGISYDEAKADPSTITQSGAEGIVGRISARPLESAALILVTAFVWALFLFLLLGCMKLGLNLVDKNSGSLGFVFQISTCQMMKFFGISLCFISLIFGVSGVARVFEMFVMGPVDFGPSSWIDLCSVIGMALVIILVLLYGLFIYLLSVYGIVDMPLQAGGDTIKKSISIVWNSYGQLVLAVLFFFLLAGTVGYSLNMLIFMNGMMGMIGYAHICFAYGILIALFFIPYFSYIYRSFVAKA
jgi:hypothetical protein